MMVSKELQQGAHPQSGEAVAASLELDLAERTVTLPEELALAFFDRLTHSQKKEYVDWIQSAKQTSTKASRAAKSVEMLAAGRKRLR